MLYRLLRRLHKKEPGQVFIAVLAFLALGSIILLPLLALTGTGLKAGMVYESKADELYAADAGVEDALWNISYSMLNLVLTDYDEYTYDTVWYYDMSDDINDKIVQIGIENMWMLYGIDAPSSNEARNIVEGTTENPPKLIVTGSGDVPVDGSGQFDIKITFIPDEGEEDSLTIARIGVWLPSGYTYVEGSSQLDNTANIGEAYYDVPEIIEYNGGTVILWDYNYALFTGNDDPYEAPFPGVNTNANTMVSTITFDYETDQEDALEAVSWVVTGGVSGITYAWDADVKIFGIYSTATTPDSDSSSSVEAYAIKSELREMVNTISGDYVAAGNSLMTDEYSDSYYIRDTLLSESSSEVDEIPEDAQIVLAYLYWSSWYSGVDEGTLVWHDSTNNFGITTNNIWTDDTSTFDANTLTLTENCSSYSDTPSSWPYTWSPGSRWTIDSGRFRGRGGSSSGNDLTSNTIPLGAYAGQTVNLSAYISDSSAEGGDILYYQLYNSSGWGSQDVFYEGDYYSGTTYTISIPEAYLTDQFRIRFYWSTNNTNEYVYLDNITLTVLSNRWSAGSHWSVYNYDQFRCYGGGTVDQQTLTLNEDIDLSAYSGQTVNLAVNVSDLSAEGGDILYYRLYNGSSWSGQQALYEGNYSSGPYTVTIPEEYLIDQFRIQFYWDANYTNEYVYMDDITIYTSSGKWTPGSHWSVYNYDQFRCYGGGSVEEQTLVLNEAVDLSDYAGQDVNLSCYISDSNAGAGDILYYRLYNGSSWSGQQALYEGNYSSGTYTISIPDNYLTDQFRIKFYWSSGSAYAYVYMDDIDIRVLSTMADTSISFEIDNGIQSYDTTLEAENYQAILTGQNTYETSDDGCAYSCFINVTDLVNTYSRQGEDGNYTGNATYTVGGVSGDTGWQLSYAGWSLVLVYASADTAGHMMYLYDAFTYADDYTSLDFDGDGVAGGDISGFLVPDQIEGETHSAKITIFVGEGDEWITGDYVALNGTKLWDGITCTSNSSSSPNNAWNGRSTAFDADGVDVDTFQATWASHVLEPGDTTAHIDLYTAEDNWNLIYIIISFRSETTTGGTFIYLVR